MKIMVVALYFTFPYLFTLIICFFFVLICITSYICQCLFDFDLFFFSASLLIYPVIPLPFYPTSVFLLLDGSLVVLPP